MTANLVPVTCTCGSTIRRNRNGQAVCRADRNVITMESLLAQGIAPCGRRAPSSPTPDHRSAGSCDHREAPHHPSSDPGDLMSTSPTEHRQAAILEANDYLRTHRTGDAVAVLTKMVAVAGAPATPDVRQVVVDETDGYLNTHRVSESWRTISRLRDVIVRDS